MLSSKSSVPPTAAFLELDVPDSSSHTTKQLIFLLREELLCNPCGRERYTISAVPLGSTFVRHGIPVFQPFYDACAVEFRCDADPVLRTIRFGGGYVVIDPPELRGLGLGSYLFSRLIEWAQCGRADFDVHPLRLPVGPDDESVQRRERFYRNFGFTIRYGDSDVPSGIAEATQVGQLRPHESGRRVRILSAADLSVRLGEWSQSLEISLINGRAQLQAKQAQCTRLQNLFKTLIAVISLLAIGSLLL